MTTHARKYCLPFQVAARNAPYASLCADPDCELSGYMAHVGPCEPCRCGDLHAVEECPGKPLPVDLDLSQHAECTS